MGDETLKFLQRSKYRPLLLKSLENEVLMPKEYLNIAVLELVMLVRY